MSIVTDTSQANSALRRKLEKTADRLPRLIRKRRAWLQIKAGFEKQRAQALKSGDIVARSWVEDRLAELYHGKLKRANDMVKGLESQEKRSQLELLGYCMG